MVMRQITQTLCTVCYKKDHVEREAAFTESITLNGGVTKRIEVCKVHNPMLIELLAFVELYGEDADAVPFLAAVPTPFDEPPPPPMKRTWGCNYCEGAFPTHQARAKHYRQDHPNQERKAAEHVERSTSLG